MNELMLEIADTLNQILTTLNNIESKIDDSKSKTTKARQKLTELKQLIDKEQTNDKERISVSNSRRAKQDRAGSSRSSSSSES